MAGDSFRSFVLDQLSGLPELRAKTMFGANGLYSADRFFAILDEGRLYFKASEVTRADYESHGMGPFTYEMKGREMTMSYYEVPPGVLEDRNEALTWARKAVSLAETKSKRKTSRASSRQAFPKG